MPRESICVNPSLTIFLRLPSSSSDFLANCPNGRIMRTVAFYSPNTLSDFVWKCFTSPNYASYIPSPVRPRSPARTVKEPFLLCKALNSLPPERASPPSSGNSKAPVLAHREFLDRPSCLSPALALFIGLFN